MDDFEIAGFQLTWGPTDQHNRIFVGNLPSCTRAELAGLCRRFGKVVASMVEGNHGYVMFENKRKANIAILVLNGSRFKSNILFVHSANYESMNEYGYGPVQERTDGVVVAEAVSSGLESVSDCMIVLKDLDDWQYAEDIRDKLVAKGLIAEMRTIYDEDDDDEDDENIDPNAYLDEIIAKGTSYGILLGSKVGDIIKSTVHFLYEDRSEYPNLSAEEAINLVALDYKRRNQFHKVKTVYQYGHN
ncbi:uncharacterized protein LOC128264408 [Drosophila gunungcola]|uniref:uncharacterized protein LOC128264408 n=1 Tax=Drosophila gunungcola TaxID=103775 RepID=UPI0022E82724|nr:uncharacterized protein LOC128264408 [Drosophila gunungcola]